MELLLLVLLVIVVGYAGVVLFYFLFQERFIFIRYPVLIGHKFGFPGDWEERTLIAADGASLHALYFKAQEPRGVVIYFHGNTGTLRRWGKHAAQFTALGLDVLMPDFRGYGKSKGKLSEAALHADADLWYDSLLDRWSEDQIVVYGRSLGSGMATPLAAVLERCDFVLARDGREPLDEARRDAVLARNTDLAAQGLRVIALARAALARALLSSPRMLLLETPFASLIDVARFYLPFLPYRLLLRYRFENDVVIRRVKCPIFIFHGKRDNVVPFTSALKLYSCIPAHVHREMFTFPKARHNDLVRFPRFKRTLRRILGDLPVRTPA